MDTVLTAEIFIPPGTEPRFCRQPTCSPITILTQIPGHKNEQGRQRTHNIVAHSDLCPP